MPLDSRFPIVDLRAHKRPNTRYAAARQPSLFIKSTGHSLLPQSDFESFAARNVLSRHLRGRLQQLGTLKYL